MIEETKETLLDVKKYAFERLNTPVFFYYLLALAVWNWDILLLILKSDCKIEETIWLIKTDYTGWNRILYPLGIAIGSNLFFPFLMLGIELALGYVSRWRIKNKEREDVAIAKAKKNVETALIQDTDLYKEMEAKLKASEDSNLKYIKDIEALKAKKEPAIKRLAKNIGDAQDALLVSDLEKYKEEIETAIISPLDLSQIEKKFKLERIKEVLKNIIYDGQSLGSFDTRIIDDLLKNEYIKKKDFSEKFELTGKGISLYYQI